jgi:hypothetical protein
MKPVLGLIFLMVVIFPTLGSAQAPVPVPVARVFDFTLQREINAELGVK